MKNHLYLLLVMFLIACTHTMAFHDIPPEDFTDTGVGCIDCLEPAIDCPEWCDEARLDDNFYLSIKQGE